MTHDRQLDLSCRHHAGRGTWLDRRVFRWPFTLSRSFRLDPVPAGMLTLILQTVSGTINAGDALTQRVVAGPGAAVHVTTQGATAICRAPAGMDATDSVELDVGDDAVLEYLPEPRILFPDSHLSQLLVLRVAGSGIGIVSDSFVPHDPQGRGRMFRRYASELVIERPDGTLLARDRIDLGAMPRRTGARVRFVAHGTLLIVAPLPAPALDALCREIESAVAGNAAIYAAASPLPAGSGVVLRVAATDGRQLRAGLAAGWFAARRQIFGADPAPRRKDAA